MVSFEYEISHFSFVRGAILDLVWYEIMKYIFIYASLTRSKYCNSFNEYDVLTYLNVNQWLLRGKSLK